MFIDRYREYCLSKVAVTEEFPFDNRTLVFKVAGKMFAALDVEDFERINLECDPEESLDLRERFEGIKPGYHMSKKHWNSIYLGMDVDDSLLLELTDKSYDLVVSGLTKKSRAEHSLDKI